MTDYYGRTVVRYDGRPKGNKRPSSHKHMASSTHPNAPCAACKFLRRKCIQGCVFSPYFPPEDPTKFANVHKIFGASNVSKLLNEIAPHQREDAVNSLAYEAEARLKDPVMAVLVQFLYFKGKFFDFKRN
ncbi:hypothetical protein L1987_05442 [Smallanthus sonchifolius]|uniref:Uncharacterized protein n=1 Tax=Smallanthus sonchifolius TaxID=185202 RepID=A0ACB9JVD3_9ASTR|nr:hypothetical protein L1987_05442 [Smallanthus sonchifolius]